MMSEAKAITGTALRILVLCLLFFLARFPFYEAPLYDEEGKFALLFVNRPAGPAYNLAARIDGKEVFTIFRHPAAMYEILRWTGALGKKWLVDPPRPDDVVTPRLRVMYSGFQLLFWLSLFILTNSFLSGLSRNLAFILTAVMMVSPLAVQTSCQLQIDNSVGVLMNGVFALTLFWFSLRGRNDFRARAVLFAASAFLALGKQEWTAVLLMALGLWLLYLFLLRQRTGENLSPFFSFTKLVIAGLAVGHVVSSAYDPENYWEGMFLMWILRDSTIASGSKSLHKFLVSLEYRMIFLFTLLALAGIGALLMRSGRKKPHPYLVLLIFFGLGLFGAFFLVGRNSMELRYFAPSLAVLTVACVALLPRVTRGRVSAGLWVLMGAMILHAAGFGFLQVQQVPHPPAILKEIAVAAERKPGVPYISSAAAWNKPEIDFVSSSMSWEEALIVVKRHGKTARKISRQDR
ncbi:MAG: hypothetical protein ABII06_22210 [Pseudomonadota bacterium]